MLTVALAGKPNAGKSTFFSAATEADAEVGNYPFTTIDPNRGVTAVRTKCPCRDRDERCGNDRCFDGKRYVPVELVDVAGLVPGAHEGRGLGNQFLDALTDADAIVNVIDAAGATNAEGEPVDIGSADPTEEIVFIESELDAWFQDILDRNWEGVTRRSRAPDFDLEETLLEVCTGFGGDAAAVTAVLRTLEYPADPIAWEDDHRRALAEGLRAQSKPIVVAANKADLAPEDLLEAVLTADDSAVPTTAAGELALRRAVERGAISYDPGDDDFSIVGDLTDEQAAGLERIRDTMTKHGGTGVQTSLNTAVYELLDHITVYPVENETRWTDADGNMLPDAVLVPTGSTPRDLAFEIHTDIGEGYLHAVDARSNRRISDQHELTEGDVIKIVSTAT